MNLRLHPELHAKLKHASEFYNLSITEIGNRAMRKWNRKALVANGESAKVATRMDNPINIRFNEELVKNKTPEEVRYILGWYLNLYTYEPSTPLHIDKEQKEFDQAVYEGHRNLMAWEWELKQGGAI